MKKKETDGRKVARGKAKSKCSDADWLKQELTRMAKLLEAGKLRVRRKPDGKVIPDDQDFLDVERDYPRKPPAAKYQLAQANALLRALQQYDADQARTR